MPAEMVNTVLTVLVRGRARAVRYSDARVWSVSVTPLPYVADRATLVDANRLLAEFGGDAALEAAARADRSRDLGNVVHFCRWRQVERLVALLAADEVRGTVH